LQAQSRKCQIYIPASEYSTLNKEFGYAGPAIASSSSSSKKKDIKPKESESEVKLAQEEIKSLKSQLQKQKRTAAEEESNII
jgi:hypothetical protein